MSTTVNREELEICKRRGHSPHLDSEWQRCRWCGLWLRAVTTIEEREDEPPEEEKSPFQTVLDMDAEAQRKKKERKK
jgi:hypothetical protein